MKIKIGTVFAFVAGITQGWAGPRYLQEGTLKVFFRTSNHPMAHPKYCMSLSDLTSCPTASVIISLSMDGTIDQRGVIRAVNITHKFRRYRLTSITEHREDGEVRADIHAVAFGIVLEGTLHLMSDNEVKLYFTLRKKYY
ncbi:MAG: hypothetical protein LBJ92_02145 [Holosporales bacterium]|jgi:hypothetical protein|nr:hypothetical protein [Holosporales bacterium]